jgi:tetratricopeptide (TPR) repeat protein/membrane associated rhomboid family serine protease
LAVLVLGFAAELAFAIEPHSSLLEPGIKTLTALGGLNSELVLECGEWYRLLSAALLHSGPWHLIVNGIVLFFAGAALERLLGRAWLGTLFVLGAVGGSLMSMALAQPNVVSVGASGAIMALLAAMFVCSWRAPTESRMALRVVALRFLIPSLIPLGSAAAGGAHIDFGAHLGGALAGAIMGSGLLLIWPVGATRPKLAKAAAVVSAAGLLASVASLLPITRDYEIALHGFRGDGYLSSGDHDRAIAEYDRAIQFDPKSTTAFFNRARAYYAKRDYDMTIADYDKAIELNPKSANAHANRGLAYASKGDYDRAIADYDQALQMRPDADDYRNRGAAHLAKKEYDRAIADYDQAIRLNPSFSYAFASRGWAYHTQKQYDRAIGDYNQAIRLDPKYVWAFNVRGFAYQEKQDYDHAMADYDKAIELDPKYAAAYNNRGWVYYLKKDYARAIADYDRALQLDPNFALARNNRALAERARSNAAAPNAS